MDIVDSQLHLGPGGIERALAGMDALGVKAALVDEFWFGFPHQMPTYEVAAAEGTIRRPVAPTAQLAALMHPDRFSYLLSPDRRDPELGSLVRQVRDSAHGRALRITPGLNRDEMSALVSGGYDAMFRAAAEAGLPVFVTIPGNALALRPLIAGFSELTFIVDHCGMPFTAAMKAGLAAAGMTCLPEMGGRTNEAEFGDVLALAELPNVALKWGHAQGLFGVAGYPFEGLRPYLTSARDAFGAERMMWAGDATANLTGESWAQLLFWLIDHPDLSASQRADFLGGTIRRLLDWPAASENSMA